MFIFLWSPLIKTRTPPIACFQSAPSLCVAEVLDYCFSPHFSCCSCGVHLHWLRDLDHPPSHPPQAADGWTQERLIMEQTALFHNDSDWEQKNLSMVTPAIYNRCHAIHESRQVHKVIISGFSWHENTMTSLCNRSHRKYSRNVYWLRWIRQGCISCEGGTAQIYKKAKPLICMALLWHEHHMKKLCCVLLLSTDVFGDETRWVSPNLPWTNYDSQLKFTSLT